MLRRYSSTLAASPKRVFDVGKGKSGCQRLRDLACCPKTLQGMKSAAGCKYRHRQKCMELHRDRSPPVEQRGLYHESCKEGYYHCSKYRAHWPVKVKQARQPSMSTKGCKHQAGIIPVTYQSQPATHLALKWGIWLDLPSVMCPGGSKFTKTGDCRRLGHDDPQRSCLILKSSAE